MIYFVTVILFSVGASFLTSFLEQYLVHKSESYKEVRDEIAGLEETKKKLEARKKTADREKKTKRSRQLKNQLDQIEADDKHKQMLIGWIRMKGMACNAVIMIMTFGYIRSMFDGVIVAKLPFEPFGLLQKATRRNLPGLDPTDCCYIFIYGLASMSIKLVIQKAMGWEAKKGDGFIEYMKRELDKAS